jgi:hypothetical protein
MRQVHRALAWMPEGVVSASGDQVDDFCIERLKAKGAIA